ncbi:autocrine proliferation repressor protein A-like [Ptychodera flava]|uniref:autocrine proliferation repressor protein A-like n=1 Tax=Ptychodera flava TaxID=63121 RepID=UPI00396AA6DD
MWKPAFAICAAIACALTCVLSTPLDDYVNRPDPHYKYEILSEKKVLENEYTVYIVNMTSQKWLTENDVDRSIWFHYMAITIPHNLKILDTAFMYITGGSNSDSPPDPLKDEEILMTSLFAVGTGSIGACLKQIPNEHIRFWGDPKNKSRTEDGIIAYTWRHFIDDPTKPDWLLRMPMTKASVRAMDTIADVGHKKAPQTNVTKFMIAGASKRGWTTWTTAAVDKRVIAAAPIVMDELNLVKNLHHHYRAYGGWTFAFSDYYEEDITKLLDNPNTQKMADIVDPLAYKDRLTMPKMIISTGGDEFFLPDDSHYYYDQLLGPSYLRITPNAEHSLILHYATTLLNLRSFFLSVVQNKKLPKMTWVRSETATQGSITMNTDTPPVSVKCYRAKTMDGKRRDFRLLIADPTTGQPMVHPVMWLTYEVHKLSDTEYKCEFPKPKTGWIAFFIQASFRGPADTTLEITTEVNIVPDVFPFPECHGEGCYGTLV